MMAGVNITVSIVEDDDAVRKILARWVSQAKGYTCVSDYANGERAVQRLPEDKPDVVLMDINLSGQNGIQCVLRLKSLMPASHFLMLTVYVDSDHIFDALAAGASGYLLKRTPRQELLDSIRQVHEGGSPMTSYIARKVVQAFQPSQAVRAELEDLSPREWEVLRLLARGYSYKELASSLGISIPTVSTHIHRTYEKLHVRSRGEAVARYAQFPQRPAGAAALAPK
jgi:RNA polymerase sigma factor (sigma-70 family)